MKKTFADMCERRFERTETESSEGKKEFAKMK